MINEGLLRLWFINFEIFPQGQVENNSNEKNFSISKSGVLTLKRTQGKICSKLQKLQFNYAKN